MVGNEDVIAIIPARSGSKRIPKKNIIDFHGKPMIAWTIEAALKSEVFSDVVVSTDSEEIAEISLRYGASIPFLRETASDDISPVSEATCSTLNGIKQLTGRAPSTVIQLMPNCPLRKENNIADAFSQYVKTQADFLISTTSYGWTNPWWALSTSENGQLNFVFEDKLKQRSQDLPDVVCPTGAIWIANVEKLLASRTFYGEGVIGYKIPWLNAIDIDEITDLDLALALAPKAGIGK